MARSPISARRDQRLTTISAFAHAPFRGVEDERPRSLERRAIGSDDDQRAIRCRERLTRRARKHTADVEHRCRLAGPQLAHELGAPPGCEDIDDVRIGRAQQTGAPTCARR